MSDPFVVKVQRSIVTNEDQSQVLIYDSNKDIYWQGDLDKGLTDAMGDRYKCYWWVIQNDKGQLELQGKPLSEEDCEDHFEQYSYAVMNEPVRKELEETA
jgi:hypothetical protein